MWEPQLSVYYLTLQPHKMQNNNLITKSFPSCQNFMPTYIPQFRMLAFKINPNVKTKKSDICFIPLNTRKPRKQKQKKEIKKEEEKEIKHGQKFTKEEDEKLKELVDIYGPEKWEAIAKEMPGRNGRQCRDRYKNYLIPGYFNGQWSQEEDYILRNKYYEYGPQWSRIAEFLKNRSSNAVKNRWNYYISKHLDENYYNITNIRQQHKTDEGTHHKYSMTDEKTQQIFDPDPYFDFFNDETIEMNDEISFKDMYF